MTTQVRPPHAARFVQVRRRPLQQFPAFPQQPLAARAANPSTIRVHRVAFGVLIESRSSIHRGW